MIYSSVEVVISLKNGEKFFDSFSLNKHFAGCFSEQRSCTFETLLKLKNAAEMATKINSLYFGDDSAKVQSKKLFSKENLSSIMKEQIRYIAVNEEIYSEMGYMNADVILNIDRQEESVIIYINGDTRKRIRVFGNRK